MDEKKESIAFARGLMWGSALGGIAWFLIFGSLYLLSTR